jgi:Prealbumin-like fold domain
MNRSSRLMATMLAALFAAVLVTPAYATGTTASMCGGGDGRHFSSGCTAEGTKFNDLNANGKRDSGEPGLAGWRIFADYDNDGVRDSGEPYADTDASGNYKITGIDPPHTTYTLREQRPGGGTGGYSCTYPNASTSGGFAAGKGGDFGCGWGPINPCKEHNPTHKDFGNYVKPPNPKITVIKKLVPATDPGRFDLKVDDTVVKAAAGDGGSGSLVVAPGKHHVTEVAAAGTDLSNYTASTSCATKSRTYGPDWPDMKPGDDVTCTITNTRQGKVEIAKVTDPHETGGAAFGFTGFAGGFSLADGGVKTITHVVPSSTPYAVIESAASGYRLSSITCTDADSTGTVSTRTASIRVAPGETVRCTFVNTKLSAGIEVVKAGPALVHHGDKMDFTFAVRSVGNSPLHNVKVTDDKCAPVSADPVGKTGGDDDALLEDGEVWTYTCTNTVPSHSAGEMDPLCNVATATGDDEQDKPVSDTDRHCTDIIHPAIAVKKTPDRTTAKVGDTIAYRFDVTNPGDVGLTVTLSDPRCDSGTLTGPEKLAGDKDDLLEPDEQWRYTCTHKVTASDPDPLPNTVHVTGKDPLGGPSGTVEGEDSASVDLIQDAPPATPAKPAAQQQVLAAEQQSTPHGRARLKGPSGCIYRPFNATVSGRQIRRVTFFVDGRRVVIRKAKSGQRTFKARIRPDRLSVGVHRVTARVVFRTASRTKARTLVLSFQHCARLAASPRFTG